MCVPLAGMATAGGLMENLGDPLGTKKRRDKEAADAQQNKWAREDQIREASQAHELALADKGIGKGNWKGGNSNRSGLQAGQSQSSNTNKAS